MSATKSSSIAFIFRDFQCEKDFVLAAKYWTLDWSFARWDQWVFNNDGKCKRAMFLCAIDGYAQCSFPVGAQKESKREKNQNWAYIGNCLPASHIQTREVVAWDNHPCKTTGISLISILSKYAWQRQHTAGNFLQDWNQLNSRSFTWSIFIPACIIIGFWLWDVEMYWMQWFGM